MPEHEPPEADERQVPLLSTASRRQEAPNLRRRVERRVGPGTRVWQVAQQTIVGTWNDGFIHAGNLAYLAMLSIFPFFVLGAAVFSLFGEQAERAATVYAVLYALPPIVAEVIRPVALSVIEARSGWLLWAGALVALWTVGSLIETIRDILRRAYGVRSTKAFWKYRLLSSGVILGSVLLLMLSLLVQVMIGAAQEVIQAYFPQLVGRMAELRLSRIVPALGLYASLYMIFYSLTPARYRRKRYPKWPGALLTTVWWIAAATLLPPVLRGFFTYDLTYGALAGVMVTLFFFWLVGLGVVIGAELNAALAETRLEQADIAGQETNRHGAAIEVPVQAEDAV